MMSVLFDLEELNEENHWGSDLGMSLDVIELIYQLTLIITIYQLPKYGRIFRWCMLINLFQIMAEQM